MKLSFYPDSLADVTEYSDDEGDGVIDHLNELVLDKACRVAAVEARVAANHIFNSLAPDCPLFVALYIEMCDLVGGPLEYLECLRAKQTDVFGKTSYVAVPGKMHTIKYFEPCSDVLEEVEEEDFLKY